jgi:sterol desaturase/sphingolipid hydroxylase (fatty acid hydroxylase superfamily)
MTSFFETVIDYIYTYGIGFALGATVIITSSFMDVFISKKAYRHIRNADYMLYVSGMEAVNLNLLGITPIVYSVVSHNMIDKSTYNLDIFKIILLICIHNFGYYIIHRSFHVNKHLYRFHAFHHRFDKVLIPSISSAVSPVEFFFAYVCPMILSAKVIPCNEPTFLFAIGIISLCNLLIHCPEMTSLPKIPLLISPQEHHIHHIERTKHYSASVIDYDTIFDIKNYTNLVKLPTIQDTE